MSKTPESGRFRWRWWKKSEGTKTDTVHRSKTPVQELDVKEVDPQVAGGNTQSTPARDVTTMEVHPSGPSETKSSKDQDVAANREPVVEDTKDAPAVQASSVERVETAGALGQPIAFNNTAEPRSLGSSDEHASEAKPAKDVPSNMEYAMEATKKGLSILKGIAEIVPFPLVKEVIELGISILDACETIGDVQSGVKQLQERITSFLVCVVDTTKAAEISDQLIKDLEDLKKCLGTIMGRLKKITDQNAFMTAALSGPNMKLIDDCEKDFQSSVERFQILRSLEMGQGILLIQQQVARFYGMSLDIEHLKNDNHEIKTDIKSIKTILIEMTSPKPMNPSVYVPQLEARLFGRDEVVQRIVEQLSGPDGARICILGPGGMGKTSVALAVINHDRIKATFGEDRYCVPCMQANSINNFIAILSKHVKAEKRTGDLLEDIMTTLREGGKRRIILLDNFETPWQGIPDAENSIKPILSRLDSIPHISILMTMRSSWAPLEAWHCEHLHSIKPEDSQRLYTSIHPDSCKYPEHLKDLLDALGHMPYAIRLMASRGKRSNVNPEKLLREWQAKGTDMLASRRDEGINQCIELSVESSYVRESEDALRILQILSMLPAGVDQQDLSIWAGEWSSQAIETLRDTALIITRPVPTREASTVDHHFVLPVVQSYMAQKGRILPEVREAVLDACYRFLTKNDAAVKGPNDSLFKKHVAAIASQEANLQALLTDVMKDQHPLTSTHLSPSSHLDALLAYINYQRWARPRPEIAELIVSLAQRVDAPRQEAAAFFCLGHILFRMDKFKDARQVFECAHVAFESVEDDLMALRSQLMQLEVDLEWGVPSTEPWNTLNNIRIRWENPSSVNPTFCAWLSYYEGYLHLVKGNYEEAISIAIEAAEQCDKLGLPYERMDSIYIVGRSYGALQDFSAALHHIDLAITLRNHLFGEGLKTPDLVNALLMRVRYLKGMGHWDDEMEATLAAALEAARELGLSGTILLLLEELAEVYVHKGDLVAAREAYEEAMRKGHGLDDYTSRCSVRQAENNLKHIDYLCSQTQGSEAIEFVPFQPPDRV